MNKRPNPLTIRIKDDLRKALKDTAASLGMSTNALVIRAIIHELVDEGKEIKC